MLVYYVAGMGYCCAKQEVMKDMYYSHGGTTVEHASPLPVYPDGLLFTRQPLAGYPDGLLLIGKPIHPI